MPNILLMMDAEKWTIFGIQCALAIGVYLAIIIPSGRVIETHTNERAVRWVWNVAITFLAVMIFIGMSGVGEVYDEGVRIVLGDGGESDFVAPVEDDKAEGNAVSADPQEKQPSKPAPSPADPNE